MKKFILIAVAILLMLPMSADAKSQKKHNGNKDTVVNVTVNNNTEEVTNITEVTQVSEAEDRYEQFDYGTYLDLVLYQTADKNVEIGIKNSWEVQRNEITSLLGAKINVWSLFKDKE